MSAAIVTVTGVKYSVTKSRSGHYTATVTKVGTWTLDPAGAVYQYAERVLHETKLELAEAKAIITQFKKGHAQ